jgi:peroxiredoxin
MKRKFTSMLFLYFLTNFTLLAQAQKDNAALPYQFEVHGLKDTTVYLANYYGEKLFYADTAYADANGRFAFKAVRPEFEGKFAVVMPGAKFFEVIIADGEEIKMETDTADLVVNMQVHTSKNNSIMYAYIDYLSSKRKEREALIAELEANEGKPEVTAGLKERYNDLNSEVVNYQKDIAKQNPDWLAAKEILMSTDVEPPASLLEEREKSYYWFKRHYFDHIDFDDDRIVRLPIFHNRFINYLNQTVIQDPDTLIKAIDALVAKTQQGTEVFKYLVHYTTYNFETSKIMGMDKVFVHMVDTYYKPAIATWMAEDKLTNIKEKADTKRYTLIGNPAPELILMDTAENWISTHKDIKTKYILLYFYDPDCGHCKKETPKLVEFYNGNNGKFDLSVYAISGNNDDKWLKFIQKNDMPFYNVSIPQQAYGDADYATNLIVTKKTNYVSLKYQEHFDVYSTPKLILLDSNRVVRAKDIGVEQLDELLERLEEMEKAEKSKKS